MVEPGDPSDPRGLGEGHYDTRTASRLHAFLRDRAAQPVADAILAATGIDCFSLTVAATRLSTAMNAATFALAATQVAMAVHSKEATSIALAASSMAGWAGIGLPTEYCNHAARSRVADFRERFGDDGTKSMRDPVYSLQPLRWAMATLMALACVLCLAELLFAGSTAIVALAAGRLDQASLARDATEAATFAGYAVAVLFASCERKEPPRRRSRRLAPAGA